MSGTKALLDVRGLSVRFDTPDGEVRAVSNQSFAIAQNEVVGIVGESGSGKSQMLMSFLGLIASNGHTDGTAEFEGTDLLNCDLQTLNGIRGRDISMIFQDPMTSLNPFLRISVQMIEVIRAHSNVSKSTAAKRCIEVLKQVQIPEPEVRFRQYPHELSGGMRQRIMIAMSLLNNPKLLIADEPTTALDVTIQAQILDLLRDLRRDFQTAIIFVTHDLGVVAELCDRVMVMYAGQIVETGSIDDIFANPQHPYTQGLIKATPRLDSDDGGQLYAIPGQPPNLQALPPGCAFADRCHCVVPRCLTERPLLLPLEGEGRAKACHLEHATQPEVNRELTDAA